MIEARTTENIALRCPSAIKQLGGYRHISDKYLRYQQLLKLIDKHFQRIQIHHLDLSTVFDHQPLVDQLLHGASVYPG